MSASPFHASAARHNGRPTEGWRAISSSRTAQFSELESFAKFGTRLDDHTRKIIDHGQRIRAILIQPELEPASVPEQIVILVALTGGVLDSVPIDKMRDAEQALRKAAADIPAEIRKRFSSNDKLSDEDRKAILQVVGKAIAPVPAKTRSRTQEEAMSDTLASLRHKISGAGDLKSVVRSMKALAASSIGQYEKSVLALADYDRTVELGLAVCLRKRDGAAAEQAGRAGTAAKAVTAIVFGSDQGLVGQFNDVLADFVAKTLDPLPGEKKVWAVGERVQSRLADAGLPPVGLFTVPTSVNAITPLVGQILVESEMHHEKHETVQLYLFHNRPKAGAAYEPVSQHLLPLDAQWELRLAHLPWPTKNLPEVIGDHEQTLRALVREYLFVSLYKACAESLAAENASRLAAMQRAEKNIDDLVGDLNQTFRRLRQTSIDEELFDVISGYECLSKAKTALKCEMTTRNTLLLKEQS